MEHIGMDLGKKESQLAILTEDGELIEKRIRTERARLSEFFGTRPRARILVEAATESEWVARCLEALGHEVIVADPNYAPMYAQRSRRIKTDRRDAQALLSACKSGTYKSAHRTSDARRHLRALLAVREGLVRTRARWISLIRTLLRRDGFRLRSGTPDTFLARVAELGVPAPLRVEIAPLLTLFAPINDQIQALDAQLAALVHTEEVLQRLTTVPGVGPVTAISFVATVDAVQRFRGAHQVQSYLGLVPQEWSSSETQRKGRITKAGNSRTRWLLVEAAWGILRGRKKPDTASLREWAERSATAEGARLPQWPLPGAWLGSSTPCGGMRRSTIRRNSDGGLPSSAPRENAGLDDSVHGSLCRGTRRGTVSASRCLAEVQSRAVDGATAPSNVPSCAGEFSLATDSAKRSMKYLAERAPSAQGQPSSEKGDP